MRDVFAAYVRSLPSAVEGVCPNFVGRIFADDRNHSCDSKMRVRRLQVRFYGRDLPKPCAAVQEGYVHQPTTRPPAHAPTMYGSKGIRTAVDAPVQTQQ